MHKNKNFYFKTSFEEEAASLTFPKTAKYSYSEGFNDGSSSKTDSINYLPFREKLQTNEFRTFFKDNTESSPPSITSSIQDEADIPLSGGIQLNNIAHAGEEIAHDDNNPQLEKIIQPEVNNYNPNFTRDTLGELDFNEMLFG